MHRIYQGRVLRVEDSQGRELPNGKQLLWEHHVLFQDAVNYYMLAVAALAQGAPGDGAEALALRRWSAEYAKCWRTATRLAQRFDGPALGLNALLGLRPEAEFAAAATRVLNGANHASPAQRSSAVLAILGLRLAELRAELQPVLNTAEDQVLFVSLGPSAAVLATAA